MTGKSKATDGALDAAGLEAACKAMCKPAGLSVWQNNMPYAEAAIRAYLASLPPPTGEEPRIIACDEDNMPERIWAGDFDEQGFGNCVVGMQGGLYSEYVRADLAAPPQVEPAEDVAELVRELRNPFTYENGEVDDDLVIAAMERAATALTSQSAELLSLRRKVEETEAALKPFAAYASLSGFDRLPADMPLTPGSGMAARQVTVADFRAAARALAGDGP